jgi:hypothetical protein
VAAGPGRVPDWPRRVRTTIRPDQDLVVDRAEWTDLNRAGLLLPGHDGTPYRGFVPTAAWPHINEED